VGRESEDKDTSGEREGFSHPDPVVDEALEWLVRQQNAPLDQAAQAQFEAWLRRNPRHIEEFRALAAMWNSPALGKAVEAMPAASRIRVARRWMLQAAAAILVIGIGVWQYPAVLLRWQADYVTATGERRDIILPDGSRMLLNTASAVAIDFTDGKRQVKLLRGEAFFDVQHDPEHPFKVAAAYEETVVKGTAFAVREEDNQDSVVLERGHVAVNRLSNSGDKADLQPGEMVSATATGLSPVTKSETAGRLAWRQGRIIFEHETLSHVLGELRRYYSGTVIVADSRLGDLIVTGNYRLDDIPNAIKTLADAAGVAMTSLPGGIIILR